MAVRLFLFDDRRARRWAPFTLTRPVGELLYGCLTLRERAERAFGARCEGHVSRAALLGFDEPGAAPTVALEDIGTEGTRVLLSSRAAPALGGVGVPDDAHPSHRRRRARRVGRCPTAPPSPLSSGCGIPPPIPMRAPPSTSAASCSSIRGASSPPTPSASARTFRPLWPGGDDADRRRSAIGDGLVSLGEGAEIEPGVYVDTREGPVRLDAGVRVEGPARLIGPLYVGRDTQSPRGAPSARRRSGPSASCAGR